jgi:hypothetical protein
MDDAHAAGGDVGRVAPVYGIHQALCRQDQLRENPKYA